MKLTTAIVGVYPNAKVQYVAQRGVTTGTVTAMDFTRNRIELDVLGAAVVLYPHEGQLQLKPLSAISDEDAVECGVICGAEPLSPDATDAEIQDVMKRVGEGLQAILSNPECELSIHLLDYLRGKSYDCGYLDTPSLIAAGVAVEM